MVIKTAFAQGIIEEAPKFGTALANITDFLLSIFGIVAIIGLVASGLLYFFSGGNDRMLDLAKRSFRYAVTGIVMTLGIYLILKLIGGFFH